jgi:hypothetical protein
MTDGVSELERQLNELKGALDLLFELREEFAQWAEEAQDGSKREALDNVLGHIEALESEYRSRPSGTTAEESEVRLGLIFCRIFWS